ncbi:hypothetical protein [Pseudomonas sp. LS.1a]|uniref:hypothetical protein n=1 Tax=Pseudomonas sp. LS.1a TaxID=2920387 RepID=UPI001F135C08|nr:hypothetical protein [Pseudomonas sp. LS.1a]UMY63898.1 hypothetical protein MKK04_11960 [Pseudomonas sp. LS.1a]
MNNDNRLPPCDAEVFENGESVGLFDSFEKEDIERLCKGLSAVTGWRIDWSYFAGRPHVRALSPAEQYPGLATAWFDPGYQEFITAEGRAATLRIGDGDRLTRYSVPLFTGAQVGEIVALRSAHLRAGEREEELRTELAAVRQHKNDYMQAAEETRAALMADIERLRNELGEAKDEYDRSANRVNQLQADLTARDQQIDALRQGMKGDYDLDAWLAFVEEAPQLRLDAERYRWLRDKAHTADWEFIGGQTPDAGEAEIDAAMAKEAQT